MWYAFRSRALVLVAHELAGHRIDVHLVDSRLAGHLHVEAVDQLATFALDLARLDGGVRHGPERQRARIRHRELRFLLHFGLRLGLLVVTRPLLGTGHTAEHERCDCDNPGDTHGSLLGVSN